MLKSILFLILLAIFSSCCNSYFLISYSTTAMTSRILRLSHGLSLEFMVPKSSHSVLQSFTSPLEVPETKIRITEAYFTVTTKLLSSFGMLWAVNQPL